MKKLTNINKFMPNEILTNEIFFADDTALITNNEFAMNKLLGAIEKHREYYGLELNKPKCNLIAMNMKSNLKFQDLTPVPQEDNTTYLGSTLTKDVDIRCFFV